MDTISYRDIMSMDKSKAQLVTRLLVTGLTVVIIFGILNFAKGCDPAGADVVCGAATRAIFITGIIACGISLALDLVGNPLTRCLLDIIIAVCGLFIAIAPGRLFALCADATSRCNTITHPFAIGMGIALCVMAFADCVVTFRKAARIARLFMALKEAVEAQDITLTSSGSSSGSSSFTSSSGSNSSMSSNSNKYKG